MKCPLCTALVLLSTLVVAPAAAFDTDVPFQGLPSASIYGATLIPDRAGVVSWKTLAKVEMVNDSGRMVPKFDPQISELDRMTIRVVGFMLPMDLGDQRHFLISAVPPHCPFCLPAGPDALMEVKAKSPIAYSLEPILLSGKFVLVKNDSYGLLYQLVDADAIRVH